MERTTDSLLEIKDVKRRCACQTTEFHIYFLSIFETVLIQALRAPSKLFETLIFPYNINNSPPGDWQMPNTYSFKKKAQTKAPTVMALAIMDQ